jgi:hypothetical protein
MRGDGYEHLFTLAWLLGLLWFAASGQGLSRLVWAAWTVAGLTVLLGRSRAGPVLPLLLAAVVLALGVTWWWADAPGSLLAGSAQYLNAIFWGTISGAVGGAALLFMPGWRRYR